MGNEVQDLEESKWLEVIGKSLAFLCLHQAGLHKKDKAEQAMFLRNLGLTSQDSAALLGTSAGSVRGLLSYSSKKRRKKVKKQSKKPGGKR